MARSFRLYGKKRGHRRTGTPWLGSFGEALFFALFFLLGCGGLVAIITSLVLPEWRASHVFVEHTCRVLDKRVDESPSEEGKLCRPEVQIEYQVRGETYRIWTYDVRREFSAGQKDAQQIIDRIELGGEYACWYNPTDPSQAVLVRGYSWWLWLTFIVPASFLLIGGGGLVYTAWTWGKSAERRSALAKRAQQLAPFEPLARAGGEYPSVPTDANITNSPGTTLAFRLPMDVSPAWALAATLGACLFWNGIVAVMVTWAVRGHLDGHPDWFLTCFVMPFLVVGLGLIAYFFRRLLLTTGIGPTILEVSDHPIQPGRKYQIFLSQAGRLKFESLEVLLVCEEEATYRHGTDTRTETRRVYAQPILQRERFEVHRGLPFTAECEWALPVGAMHSFKSPHNEISWRLLVRGRLSGWPGFERSFRIIVCPTLCGNGRRDRRSWLFAEHKAREGIEP